MAIGNVSETAAFLSAPQGPLAVHVQTGQPLVRTVVIVPPPVEERKACHRALAAAGRLLAAQGAAVLRVDPRGSGDSPGAFPDFSVPDWSADLCAAARALRQMHPQVPQFWLGVRASALLVLQQASRVEESLRPDGLLLWEPVSGPDFLRQLLQRRLVNEMIAYGQARLGRRAIEERLAAGETVDLDGFPLSGRLYRDLQDLAPAPWNRPALIVSTGPDARTADACRALAPDATRLDLRLPPFWNAVGHVDTRPLEEATATWAAEALRGKPERHPAAAEGTQAQCPCPHDLLQAATPDNAERMVGFPGAVGTVRGVLHQAIGPAGRGRLLFLHGWSGDRCGPHRMFVHAARAWALRGYASLRIDLRGRGDSADAPEGATTIASMTADARAAIDWLRSHAPASGPITVVAICSGCKVAIGAAAAGPEPVRLALWSAESMGSLRDRATGRRKLLATLRTYGRKLLRPETWRKLLRGELRAGMVGRALVQEETRSPDEARAEDQTLRTFRRHRGDILFVFGGSDPDAPGSSKAYARYCLTSGIPHTSHTVPHAGHSYYGVAWEEEVLRVTGEWLQAT